MFLESLNGGPLTLDFPMQTELEMQDKNLSEFDLYEAGAVADMATFVDAQWRRETRPKRIRLRSADNQARDKPQSL